MTYTIKTEPSTTVPDRGPEWLLTNGTGGYAMGTAGGVNTRRYHGLLIVSQCPPVQRFAVLNQILERLVPVRQAGHKKITFTSCRFRDTSGNPIYAPEGHRWLRSFEKSTAVTWHYQAGPVHLSRRLELHWKRQAATLHYIVSGLPTAMVFSLSPMVTFRDFHRLLSHVTAPKFKIAEGNRGVTVHRPGAAATFTCSSSRFVHAPDWWYAIDYAADAARGQEHQEDYFVPGRFETTLNPTDTSRISLTVTWGDGKNPTDEEKVPRTIHAIPGIERTSEDWDAFQHLAFAADDFIIDRPSGHGNSTTIIAGYPWFTDWGRDTFISLPGLLLCTGRFDEAARTLRVYADAMRDGLVPNRFDEDGNRAAHYNTADASLWFARAALEYVDAASDISAWETWLRNAVMHIIEAYVGGTPREADPAEQILVDDDGLVRAGSVQTQWTWMDAARDGVVSTPRHGKAVEINALWHHVLTATARIVHGSDRRHLTRMAARARRAFKPLFWCPSKACLADHVWVDGSGALCRSTSLRPNQIFAVSLEYSPLELGEQRQVLEAVRRDLLTPFGLRTLSQNDPEYRGHYGTAWFERDAAYHQGTVWPWLIGPYAEALMRVHQFSTASCRAARETLAPLLHHLQGEGLGQLHEIHDGDPPHQPAGCMAQAWSVAETLRALVLTQRPPQPQVT